LTQRFADVAKSKDGEKAGDSRIDRKLGPFAFVEFRDLMNRHLPFLSQKLDGSLAMRSFAVSGHTHIHGGCCVHSSPHVLAAPCARAHKVAAIMYARGEKAADNFLRPLLIRRGADMPLLLVFAGVIGGLFAFGLVGIFVGPVVLAVAYKLLETWLDDEDRPSIAILL
jgi:hypothetical protein